MGNINRHEPRRLRADQPVRARLGPPAAAFGTQGIWVSDQSNPSQVENPGEDGLMPGKQGLRR